MVLLKEKGMDLNKLLNEFKTEGLRCEAVIKTVGRSGGQRAIATIFFGLAGFAAMSGQKKEKALGKLCMKEKGLRFIPDNDKYIEIRIPWEDILHLGTDKYSNYQEYLVVYNDNESTIQFMFDKKVTLFLLDMIEDKCNLLKYDLEGWE